MSYVICTCLLEKAVDRAVAALIRGVRNFAPGKDCCSKGWHALEKHARDGRNHVTILFSLRLGQQQNISNIELHLSRNSASKLHVCTTVSFREAFDSRDEY